MKRNDYTTKAHLPEVVAGIQRNETIRWAIRQSQVAVAREAGDAAEDAGVDRNSFREVLAFIGDTAPNGTDSARFAAMVCQARAA